MLVIIGLLGGDGGLNLCLVIVGTELRGGLIFILFFVLIRKIYLKFFCRCGIFSFVLLFFEEIIFYVFFFVFFFLTI